MTEELWQLYDEQGHPLVGQGADKKDVFNKGLLHGAAHVWIWRNVEKYPEVLLQKRASIKRTWPNIYDISAAGHIDLGEEPVAAAVRETKEEIGLDIADTDLKLIKIVRANMIAPDGAIENEFCWIYIYQYEGTREFIGQESEVASLNWKNLAEFREEVIDLNASGYVPHGPEYFSAVISAIASASSS